MQKIPSEEDIAKVLTQLVKHLKHIELAQAEAVLVRLSFHRLLNPVYKSSKGKKVRFDPVAYFGTSRVLQTAAYVADCEESIERGKAHRAHLAAIAAATRWTGRERDLQESAETKAICTAA
ncbi:hypothetical protein [Paludibaculum fermentans]|uniref:hypothetical protein n=1 Tax=Paludibaculum fermentans TaxID=1473598 RepID=UPI003EB8A324